MATSCAHRRRPPLSAGRTRSPYPPLGLRPVANSPIFLASCRPALSLPGRSRPNLQLARAFSVVDRPLFRDRSTTDRCSQHHQPVLPTPPTSAPNTTNQCSTTSYRCSQHHQPVLPTPPTGAPRPLIGALDTTNQCSQHHRPVLSAPPTSDPRAPIGGPETTDEWSRDHRRGSPTSRACGLQPVFRALATLPGVMGEPFRNPTTGVYRLIESIVRVEPLAPETAPAPPPPKKRPARSGSRWPRVTR